MQNRPLRVGITGGIGSGKSTVCKVLETLGYNVYYADDRAKWLMNNDKNLKNEIVSLFGDDAYIEGELNRIYIGNLVFNNEALLEKLNARVHPAVGKDFIKWTTYHDRETLLFNEAALMFEIGSYKRMDATILVTAPEALRVKRVLLRDRHRSEESVREIINQQMMDHEKIPLANYVIENDEKKSIIKQTLNVYQQLLNRHK